MLIAITLTLVSETDLTLPPHLGRANYAATLARLTTVAPALAQAIHDSDGPKPLTCSGLLNAPGNRDGAPLQAGAPYYVRITGLTAAVSAALEQGLLTQPPTVWELDRRPFRVQAAVCDETADAWSGRADYATLAAEQLLAADERPRHVTLQFAAPTSFRSQEMHLPVPLPGLVFGSLAERWNAFSPVAISPEMRRFAEERIAIAAYQLRSRPITHEKGALRIGGLGQVTYRALSHDRYWLGVMHLLAHFARFSGVGVQTTTGMGQTRRLR